jgi:hypothetical protein
MGEERKLYKVLAGKPKRKETSWKTGAWENGRMG